MANELSAAHSEPVTPAHTITRVFCPEGHNLLDICYPINALAGIKLGFRRKNGRTGLVVLSPTLGCFDKNVLAGDLLDGEKVDLFCPECGSPLHKMGTCGCRTRDTNESGEWCILYLSEEISAEEAIAICDVAGCHNSSIRHAGEFIQA